MNFSLTVCIENKALYFSLRGKALNVTAEYDIQAVDFLSKAVKLDPTLTDAWNNLGECYWKSKDVDAAKNCFTQALSKVNKSNFLLLKSLLLCTKKSATHVYCNAMESADTE